MRKKIISLLLCIVLCLSLMPMSAFAADEDDYGIWVNDTDITSANETDVLGDGGRVKYDSTLNKLSISSFVGDLTIEGNGTVNIEVNSGSTTAVTGKLTVKDANNVSVTSNSLDSTLLGGAEIDCTGNVEIKNEGSTSAVSGKLTVTAANDVKVASNSSNPTLLGGADIACTGDVMITNKDNGPAVVTGLKVTGAKNVTVTSKGCVVGGELTVNGAGNVTVKKTTTSDNINAAVNGKATIDCTGDVLIENYGNTNAVSGPLTVNAANDVTVTSAGTAPNLGSIAKITCSGNIRIENSSTGGGINGPLTIIDAKNVTVIASTLDTAVIGANNESITNINCSGNLLIDSKGIGFAVAGKLNVTGANDVTVKHSSTTTIAPTVTNGADIACTGNVAITNEGSNLAVANGLKVTGAKNVTVSSKGSCPVISGGGVFGGAEITCTGDVSIINKSTGNVVGGDLTVDGAKNVTVKNEVSTDSPNHAISSVANITCSGDVLIQCYGTGTGNAVGGKLTYHRIPGAGSYYVNVGDTESELTTIAAKAESEVYGPENRYKKIINIVSIPVGAYTIIDNVNSEWTKGSSVGLTITSDAPFDKFIGVKIDGNEIAATNYTAASGSTKITLNAAYLETLSEGSHSIDVVSIDGVASTNFTIKATNPIQTGDNSNMLLWVALLFISGGAFVGTAVYGRKRKHN